MVRNLSIDIETYSDVDLSKCGVYKYVEGDFHILLFAYAFDDEDVKIVDMACGEELPQEVLDAIDDRCHQVGVERTVRADLYWALPWQGIIPRFLAVFNGPCGILVSAAFSERSSEGPQDW